jgi:predicted ArsR family transcriptional regulator
VSSASNGSARASAVRIETALQGAADGLTMRELISSTGLHENAIRRTLGRLVSDGTVHVGPEPRSSRGRPLLRYRRAGAPDEPFRRFLPLLLDLVDRAPGTDADAYEIGRAAGAASRPATVGAPGAVASVLVQLGFAPRRVGTSERGGTRMALGRCPFGDAVTSAPRGASICALHHGLLAGVATASGGELESFTVRDPRVLRCEVSVR